MPRRPDIFSENLFEAENPNTPELLHRVHDSEGSRTVDSEGNEYGEQGDLVREKQSDALVQALNLVRRLRHGEDVEPNDPEVQFYRRQYENKKKNT